MIPKNFHFYDLPVYRVSRERYEKDFEKFLVDTATKQHLLPDFYLNLSEDHGLRSRDILRDKYGGRWDFNEIVGYIRLHFLGTQIRGEYFGSPNKRIRRSKKKSFVFKTWKLAPEITINPPHSSEQILESVREYIKECEQELPRRYIDTSTFEALAPYVDWKKLFSNRGED